MVSEETQDPKQATINYNPEGKRGGKGRFNIWVDLGSVFVHILKVIDKER